jgi:hypothetical protein
LTMVAVAHTDLLMAPDPGRHGGHPKHGTEQH